MNASIKIEVLNLDFSVCKVTNVSPRIIDYPFTFTGRTDKELSLVCQTQFVPAETISREDGWKAFRVVGELDFSLIGILSAISSKLADNQIGIFAISTFNTDYILVKKENWEKAKVVLKEYID